MVQAKELRFQRLSLDLINQPIIHRMNYPLIVKWILLGVIGMICLTPQAIADPASSETLPQTEEVPEATRLFGHVDLSLTGIFYYGEQKTAILNRTTVREGDTIKDFQVVRIEEDRVILKQGEKKITVLLGVIAEALKSEVRVYKGTVYVRYFDSRGNRMGQAVVDGGKKVTARLNENPQTPEVFLRIFFEKAACVQIGFSLVQMYYAKILLEQMIKSDSVNDGLIYS